MRRKLPAARRSEDPERQGTAHREWDEGRPFPLGQTALWARHNLVGGRAFRCQLLTNLCSCQLGLSHAGQCYIGNSISDAHCTLPFPLCVAGPGARAFGAATNHRTITLAQLANAPSVFMKRQSALRFCCVALEQSQTWQVTDRIWARLSKTKFAPLNRPPSGKACARSAQGGWPHTVCQKHSLTKRLPSFKLPSHFLLH